MPVVSTARLKYVSIPPRKMRLVANLVKGMPIQKALDVLNFTKRVAAQHIAKTLKSAAANALSIEGSTSQFNPEDLHVKSITVDAAPSAKRIRFQSMGRVFRYRKRHSHLTVVLEERPSVVTPPAPTAGKAKTKVAAEGTSGVTEETAKKATPKKAKSATKTPAKKASGKAGKKTAAKPKKKSAPAKKSKSTK
jgi:large subunit ribosomal protein L22